MFEIIDNKTVKSSLGFTVNVPDIHFAFYSENNAVFKVEIEGGMKNGVVDWIIYSQSLKAENKVNNFTRSSQEILNRISQAFFQLEMKNEIV